MNIGTQFRQGDVFLVRVADALPEAARKVKRDNGRVVLAYGEVTGHSHAILDREAELFTLPDTDDRFLRIMAGSGVDLVHEEHTTISLPPGDYRIRIQREYVSSMMPARQVAD
jgi:hypothetical protein